MVIVGYGEYKNYKLQEIPQEFLNTLAIRFPLKFSSHDQSDRLELLITIAVHEELERRSAGGKQFTKRPTKKDLAVRLVNKGFRDLSKLHHPDRQGDEDTQKELSSAREFLISACDQIQENRPNGAVFIPSPDQGDPPYTISDEDIPF